MATARGPSRPCRKDETGVSDLVLSPDAIVRDRVKRFTQSTNSWAALMRHIMGRRPGPTHRTPYVMYRETEGGLVEKGVWWISDLEDKELERIMRNQQLYMQEMEAILGTDQFGVVCEGLLRMMRERFPDLVDWTNEEPVREGIEV
jgi:hypothetical protein